MDDPTTAPAPPVVPGEAPPGRLEQLLGRVPSLLASHPHVLWLLALGVYLVVLPLIGVHVPAEAELIGGNYTNVTSAIGGCIAAGGTAHLVRRGRARDRLLAQLHRKVDELGRHGRE